LTVVVSRSMFSADLTKTTNVEESCYYNLSNNASSYQFTVRRRRASVRVIYLFIYLFIYYE